MRDNEGCSNKENEGCNASDGVLYNAVNKATRLIRLTKKLKISGKLTMGCLTNK